jgi:DNA-binding beta-propeller fold protein YncE
MSLAYRGALVLAAAVLFHHHGPADPPNPYRTIEGWAKLPEGRVWGATSAVDIDKDGRSVWVAERCGANSCANSALDPILHFDPTGKLIKSFGAGIFAFPHGICVDPDGNIWVTDGQVSHQVFKFNRDGRLLMVLGKKGGGRDADFFYQPNDVLVAPNGDIFVAEGHGAADVGRIVKISKDGTLIKTWGRRGSGRGEFDQPHGLAMDSHGRLFVADRSNNRIQIFDQNGTWLAEWKQFSRPSGLFIDKHDVLYVADSESGDVEGKYGYNLGWKRGLRVGSAKDGLVSAFIPDPKPNANGPGMTSAAEGVAADVDGVIYGAEVGPRGIKRYVKK